MIFLKNFLLSSQALLHCSLQWNEPIEINLLLPGTCDLYMGLHNLCGVPTSPVLEFPHGVEGQLLSFH